MYKLTLPLFQVWRPLTVSFFVCLFFVFFYIWVLQIALLLHGSCPFLSDTLQHKRKLFAFLLPMGKWVHFSRNYTLNFQQKINNQFSPGKFKIKFSFLYLLLYFTIQIGEWACWVHFYILLTSVPAHLDMHAVLKNM